MNNLPLWYNLLIIGMAIMYITYVVIYGIYMFTSRKVKNQTYTIIVGPRGGLSKRRKK